MLKITTMLIFMSLTCFDLFMKIMWFSITTMLMITLMKFSMNGYISTNSFYINTFSLGLSILTMFMTLTFINSMLYLKEKKDFSRLMNLTYMMSFTVIMSFLSSNLIQFYMFFEFSIIPIFLIILGWGYQPERISASLYLMFYTIFFSLPFLMFLVSIYYKNFNLSSLNHNLTINTSLTDMTIMSMGISAFLVKMPIFMLHIWLPKAHVEAPVGGSMFLASILLKLGIYGLYRIMPIFILKNNKILSFLNSFILIGGIIMAFTCLYQYDLKVLIAYSSIAHMSVSSTSLLTMTNLGISGAYSMSLCHGFCSSSLFFLSFCNYKRTNSRSFYMNKGLLNIMPSMMMFWLIFSIVNMSAPPFLNIFSEIIMIMSIISFSLYFIPFIMIMLFLSCTYSIYLYSLLSHGKMNNMNHPFYEGKIMEYINLTIHLIPLISMIFFMENSLMIH